MKNEFNRLIKDLVEPFMVESDSWLTTDGITERIAESADLSTLIQQPDALRKILKQAIAQQVRQSIRSRKDEGGFPLFANLSYEDEDGKCTHLYKHNDSLDAEDSLKLRSYWIENTIAAKNKAVFYDRLYSEKTGKQLPLPFDSNSFLDD